MNSQINYIIAITVAALAACSSDSNDGTLSGGEDFAQNMGAPATSQGITGSFGFQPSIGGQIGADGNWVVPTGAVNAPDSGGFENGGTGGIDNVGNNGGAGGVAGFNTSQAGSSGVGGNSTAGSVGGFDTSQAGSSGVGGNSTAGGVAGFNSDDTITLEDAIASIEESDIRVDLTYLASDELEGRKAGTEGDKKAIDYIVSKFKEFGLEGKDGKNTQPFTSGNISTANVIGFLPGSDPILNDEVIVVGGHHDHVGVRFFQTYNGADDNASGVAAIIAVAKAMSKFKGQLKRTVVFMTFAAEELGLLGSKFYCDNPWFPIDKTVFMIDLDMVGHATENKVTALVESSSIAQALLTEICEKYTVCINKPPPSGSDHDSFIAKGVPVHVFYTDVHDCYHRACDTIDTIDMAGVTAIARISFELIYQLAESDLSPRSNFAIPAFRSVGPLLDHGRERFLEN